MFVAAGPSSRADAEARSAASWPSSGPRLGKRRPVSARVVWPARGSQLFWIQPLDPAPFGPDQWGLGGGAMFEGPTSSGGAELRLTSRVVAPGKFNLLEGGGSICRGICSPAIGVARVVLGFPSNHWPRRLACVGPRPEDPQGGRAVGGKQEPVLLLGVSLSVCARAGIPSQASE